MTPADLPPPPNVIVIYADDLGFGDVGCYGARDIPTPNMDALARSGCRFTSAYAPAATCTPSRYALLTGQYAWRKPGTDILPGDASLIIPPGSVTLPAVLQRGGYFTAVIGKWHLGLGEGKLNWNVQVKPGPNEIGFDYSFIMPATLDRVPCVFMENGRVVGLDPDDPIVVDYNKPVGTRPTGLTHPELLKVRADRQHSGTIVNGVSRIGHMAGGESALWRDEEITDTLVGKACAFIENNRDRPFFLYYAAPEPHVPRVPHPRFAGRTPHGARGDVITQLDWAVGEIMDALRKSGLERNTLVILTSDNGPVLHDGYKDEAVERNGAHRPAGPWRGGKYSPYEGGTRVPFIVNWPGTVAAGESAAMISQVDLLASLAALARQPLAKGDAADSQDLLPVLLGRSASGRDWVIEQGYGNEFGFREGKWKLVWKPKSGVAELYDLDVPPPEQSDVSARYPEQARVLRDKLLKILKGAEPAL